jgi:hypothetical protein
MTLEAMANTSITVNGQQYDGPESMPPDVRRLYEEAMRTVKPPLAGGPGGGSTQVFTGRLGEVEASVVVNRVVTMKDSTYGSIDELPPDVRRLYENALAAPAGKVTQPRTGFHVSVNMAGPEARSGARTPIPLPFDSTSTEARLRSLPMTLAIIVVVGLVLWFFLGH